VAWSDVDKTGSDITDIVSRSHQDLQNVLPANTAGTSTDFNRHVSDDLTKSLYDHTVSTSVHHTFEQIQDDIGAFATSGTGISVTYDDVGNKLYVASSVATPYTWTQEAVEDAVGNFVTAGTGLAVTYDDAGDKLYVASLNTHYVGLTVVGAFQAGSSTDYISTTASGFMQATGAATWWDDIRIEAERTRIGVVAPTDETGFRGDANFYSRNFVYTQADEVQFDLQFPHGVKSVCTVYPHVHFSPWGASAATATPSVQFMLEYYWADYNSQFPAAASTLPMIASWAADKQWYHVKMTNSTGVAYNKALSSIMKCRLYRDNTVANNYPDKAAFLSFDIHCEMDTIGSNSEWSKT
jgi:hypothetical protein